LSFGIGISFPQTPDTMPTISYNFISTVAARQYLWYKIVRWRRGGKPRRLDSNEVKMSLASKIKELRLKKKKSLQDVADEVEASKAHIWDLETGKSKNPSIDLLTKLAKCFGVSVAELIGENPAAKGVDPQVVAMYRELKELSPADRQAIQAMMDHLKTTKPKS
jgi:transcriptional regulator with XRE-family HTH domain